MTSKPLRRWRWTRVLGVTTGVLLLAGIAGAGAFYLAFVRDLPDIQHVEDYHPRLASHVYDRAGRPLGTFFDERRELTPLADVPEHVVHAFVAGEDSAFFEHQGIDYQSILRAAWVNFWGGEIRQGASTITQQMVKTLLLTPERTYRRKIREMILARRIEQRLTKDEILYLYLNQIYFGNGAYGIGEAARTYFDKPVPEITVSEGALLAGLPKAPSANSPFRNPARAEERRQYVLARMRDDAFIDDEAYEKARSTPPALASEPHAEDFAAAAYFTEEVRRWLFESLGGDQVLGGGLRIETTLDLPLQRAATAAVTQGLEDLDMRQGYRGPLRKVEADALEEEILALGRENGLVADDEGDEEPEVLALTTTEEPAASSQPAVDPDEGVPGQIAWLAERAPAPAVVVAVDREANRARVSFGPGTSGFVDVEDVAWARKANPQAPGQAVERIDRVFEVGDVALFRLRPPDPASEEESGTEEAAEPEEELRVTLYQTPLAQGALLSLEVGSGDVLALVGGYDFAESEFNRVTQARRQPGSAFKPLLYGAALSQTDEEGAHVWTPASIIHDRATIYEDRSSGFVWKPENYTGKFYGPITLRRALAKSINNAAVHLANEVGIADVLHYARRLGIESPLERSLALALGSSDVSLFELTRAYGVFPNAGRRVVPRFIRRVLDRDGNVLYENVALGAPPQPLPDPEAPGRRAGGAGRGTGRRGRDRRARPGRRSVAGRR